MAQKGVGIGWPAQLLQQPGVCFAAEQFRLQFDLPVSHVQVRMAAQQSQQHQIVQRGVALNLGQRLRCRSTLQPLRQCPVIEPEQSPVRHEWSAVPQLEQLFKGLLQFSNAQRWPSVPRQ